MENNIIRFNSYKLERGGLLYDMYDQFNARVGDQGTPLVMQWTQGLADTLIDLQAKKLHFYAAGQVGQYLEKSKDGTGYQMSADASQVEYEDRNAAGTMDHGITKVKLPKQFFPQEGIFYGYFGLKDDQGNTYTSVNVWFRVLGGVPIMGAAIPYFSTRFDELMETCQGRIEDVLAQLRQEYQDEVKKNQDMSAETRAALSKLADAVGAVQAQIDAGNVVTLKKHNEDITKLSGQISNTLSKMNLNMNTKYATLDDIQKALPDGAEGLFVLDNGHRAVFRNSKWIDGGIFQASGPNPKNFWATYHFAVSKLLDITKRNLITYDNLAINTYLNNDTGDYLPNMAGYDATDYIAVKPNTAYHLHPGWLKPDKALDKNSHIVTFYNQNFEYMNKYYADTLNFTTPQDACYLRVAFPIKEVGTLSLQMGTQYDWTKNPPELQIKPEAIGDIESSVNNLLNITMPFSLNYGLDDSGNLSVKNNFSTYDFINLKGAKQLSFSTSPARIAFFDQNYACLSVIDYPDNGTAVPINAVYIRVQYNNAQMESQTANGNFLQISPTAFLKEPSNGREVLKNVLVEDYHQPKVHLSDALNQWLLGRKFPIGFLGDSTTEGDNTSAWTDDNQHIKQDQSAGGIGKVNYVNTTSYSYLTQQLLRQRTGNDAPEIYNMGWSGTSMFWMIQHFDEVFNNAYSDVRMIGIEYGINDRNDYGNRDVLAQTYRYDLIRLIQMLYDRGIQPFIITSQAIWNHQADGTRDVLNTVTLTTLINRIKKEVAREYHLELIDMQEVGDLIAKYSSVGWNSFNNGILHFKDLGHQAEARYIYGKITDELETIESGSILSYLSQRVLSDVHYGDNLQTADNGFKYTVNLTTSGKQLLQQFSVMNPHPQALQLIACCSTPDGQTVEVDGTTYQITSTEQDITKLEPGPHIIRAFNDATKTATNWLGFKLK